MKLIVDNEIILKNVQLEDVEYRYKVIDENRKFLKKWLGWLDYYKGSDDLLSYTKECQERAKKKEAYAFSIYYLNEFVGCIEIKEINNIKKECEIGYWLAEKFNRKGIMTRCCKAIINYIFNELKLNKITILVATENYSSQSIPQKLKFINEGILNDNECLYGKLIDNYIYVMTQEIWRKINNKEVKMKGIIKEPNTFRQPNTHYIAALKNNWYKQLVMLENLITEETVKFYSQKGIITMHLPVTTGSISSPMGRGSDSKPVSVNLEGVDTYLADSMQFLLEYGCRLTEKGCYYVMPSFRGEKADERHLCQFYHSEAEIPGTLEDVMSLVDEYIKYLAKRILERMGEQLKETVGDVSHIEKIANYKGNFIKITFDEAERVLKEKYPENIKEYIEYEDGWRNITRKAEKALIEIYDGIVWVTNYDDLAVPFYQKLDSNNKGTTRNADLLMGIGETAGCGERHKDYKELLEALERHCVLPEEYEWYIEMKKQFPMQTSGFGMGIERFLMWVLKATDIRNMQICLRFNGENILP